MQSIKDILLELLLEELTIQQWERNQVAKRVPRKQPDQVCGEGERKSA
jgi:hypothetical protein